MLIKSGADVNAPSDVREFLVSFLCILATYPFVYSWLHITANYLSAVMWLNSSTYDNSRRFLTCFITYLAEPGKFTACTQRSNAGHVRSSRQNFRLTKSWFPKFRFQSQSWDIRWKVRLCTSHKTREFTNGHPQRLPACIFLSQYYFYNIFLQNKKSLAGFLFKFLQSLWQRKPEVALDFCIWLLRALGVLKHPQYPMVHADSLARFFSAIARETLTFFRFHQNSSWLCTLKRELIVKYKRAKSSEVILETLNDDM